MRRVATGVIVLAVTLGLYLAVDAGFGLFLRYQNQLFPPDPNDVPGNRGQPYATSEFVVESFEFGRTTTIPGTDLLMPWEEHGRYYNMDRLEPTGLIYRRTVNPESPRRPTVTVLFVGGSNIYGTDVSDDMTIPSRLSQVLNARDPAHGYVVINAGARGSDSYLEKLRLAYELEHGQKPDIVLVMGGGIDVLEGVYLTTPGQPAAPMASGRSWAEDWFYRLVPLNIYRSLRAWGAAHAADFGLRRPPAQIADSAQMLSLTESVLRHYVDNQIGMAQMAKKAGARFISILEPNMYASDTKDNSADVVYVNRQMDIHVPGMRQALPGIIPLQSAAQAGLAGKGIETLDLSAIFRDKTGNIFTSNPGHYNGTGSGIVAERIAGAILQPQAVPGP